MCSLKELNAKLESWNKKLEDFKIGDWMNSRYSLMSKWYVILFVDLILTCIGFTVSLSSGIILSNEIIGKSNYGLPTEILLFNFGLGIFLSLFGAIELPRDVSKRYVAIRLDKKIKDGIITKASAIELEKDYDLGFLLIATLQHVSVRCKGECEPIEISKDHNPSEAEI